MLKKIACSLNFIKTMNNYLKSNKIVWYGMVMYGMVWYAIKNKNQMTCYEYDIPMLCYKIWKLLSFNSITRKNCLMQRIVSL